MKLLDGTSSSDTAPLFSPCVFSLGLYPGLVMVVVKGSLLLLVFFLTQVLIWENGSGLPRRQVQVYFHAHPFLRRRAIFFLALGLGEVFALGMPGTFFRRQREQGGSGWSVQPTGPVHWHWSVLIRCIVRAHGQTSARYTLSAPPPPTTTTIQSGEAPLQQAPKQAAQPNPSYPALCRQDTTSPWSTDYGGNS